MLPLVTECCVHGCTAVKPCVFTLLSGAPDVDLLVLL